MTTAAILARAPEHLPSLAADSTTSNLLPQIERHADLIYRASPYWVSADLSKLVGVAFASVPSDFVLAPHHFPTPAGFVVFDHAAPLTYPAPMTDEERAAAVYMDNVVRDDGVLSLDLDGHDDIWAWDEEEEVARTIGPAADRTPTDIERAKALYWEHNGHDVTFGFIPRQELHGVGSSASKVFSVLMHGEDFTFGAPLAEVKSSVSYMAAFLLLAGERLSTTTLQRPTRPERRRAERAGEPPPPDLRVVTLRAVDSQRGEPGDEPGDYDYRWLVRGHWHRYWKGPVGEQRLEPQWVGPYVKGPDDKPLRVHSGELFKVSR